MAGTITGSITRIQTDQDRPKVAKVVLTCTAGSADHLFPSTVLNTLILAEGFNIKGMKLHSVRAIPDAVTPPTNGTSVTIKDEYGVDLMDGAGDVFIPDAGVAWTNLEFLPALITGNLTVAITGNLVNSAGITLVLELVGT